MSHRSLTGVILGAVLVFGGVYVAADAARQDAAPVSAPQPLPSAAAQRALLDRYCISCHNDRLKTGGLSLDTAAEYAGTGVDYLAVGALTHSVRVLDIGLDL